MVFEFVNQRFRSLTWLRTMKKAPHSVWFRKRISLQPSENPAGWDQVIWLSTKLRKVHVKTALERVPLKCSVLF